MFTLSRTPIGLATLAVGVLLLAATRPRVWVPVLVVGAALFLATPLRARMTDFDTDRLVAVADRAGGCSPTTGSSASGPASTWHSLPAYQQPGVRLEDVTPHNSLLYVAAESGVFAALALAVAIALSLRFLRTRNPIVLGPMLGLAAFMVDAMTTNLYSIPIDRHRRLDDRAVGGAVLPGGRPSDPRARRRTTGVARQWPADLPR